MAHGKGRLSMGATLLLGALQVTWASRYQHWFSLWTDQQLGDRGQMTLILSPGVSSVRTTTLQCSDGKTFLYMPGTVRRT